MPEPDARTKMYETVAETLVRDGFHTVTAADVRDVCGRLLKGSAPQDQVGRAIAARVAEHLGADRRLA